MCRFARSPSELNAPTAAAAAPWRFAIRDEHQVLHRQRMLPAAREKRLATQADQKGSHHIYGKPGERALIVVPVHGNQSLKPGLQRAILKLASLAQQEPLRELVNNEPAEIKIWARFHLGREPRTAVAKECGYQDGHGGSHLPRTLIHTWSSQGYFTPEAGKACAPGVFKFE